MIDITCFECAGTGSSVPDCELCEGYRSIKVKRAYAKGWKKHDLSHLIEDDGYCECPECYDDASACMFCYGDGRVSQFVKDQQRNRILITARRGYRSTIPVCFTHDNRDGRIKIDREINLLSNEHARELRDQHLINWYCSVFGDEIYLTPKGEDEAKKAWRGYRELCRAWVHDERERRLEQQLSAIVYATPRVIEGAF